MVDRFEVHGALAIENAVGVEVALFFVAQGVELLVRFLQVFEARPVNNPDKRISSVPIRALLKLETENSRVQTPNPPSDANRILLISGLDKRERVGILVGVKLHRVVGPELAAHPRKDPLFPVFLI